MPDHPRVPVGEAPMRSAILLAITETWPHDDPWCSTCAGRMVDAITDAIKAQGWRSPSFTPLFTPHRMRFIAGAILAPAPKPGDVSEAASLLAQAAAALEPLGPAS